MAQPNLQTIVQRLQRLADADGPAAVPDTVLLRRFVGDRDAAAFELLVWRHGAMVLATCRRVLGPRPDVEDAFQATFLALLRQARSVRQHESLAGWLHRVAHRVSLYARKRAQQRSRREIPIDRVLVTASPVSDCSDVRPILDDEIERLPERLRLAVALCYLEGKTTEEAGRLLGCPKGTILSRLARARDRLRGRLMRRGVTLAAGFAAIMNDDSLPAAMVDAVARSAALVLDQSAAVAPAVAVLTEGVLRTMMLSKLKMVAAGVLVIAAMLGAGAVVATRPVLRAEDTADGKGKAASKPGSESPLDAFVRKPMPADSLKGAWNVVSVHVDGTRQDSAGMRWLFGPTSVDFIDGAKMLTADYKLDPKANPAQIDLTFGKKSIPGIYGRNGNSLVIHLPHGDAKRPKEKDTTGLVFQLERIVADKPNSVDDPNIEALPDADALKRENAKLLDALKSEQVKRQAIEQRIAELQRLAEQQRDAAVADRRKAEDAEQEAKRRDRVQADQALSDAAALRSQLEHERQKLDAALKDKENEIALLRAKLPIDKWDSGWSEVRVNVDGHWSLRILADGSGIYGYGPNCDDFCTIPAGTFTFEQVRRELLARSKLDPDGANCEISLKRKGEKGTLLVFSPDGAFALELLRGAHAKGSTPSLDLRWEKTPPRAGLQPTTIGTAKN